MTQFLTPDTQLPPYMAFPKFLLDATHLSETAKILYMLLLDRARLSQKNEGWTDEAVWEPENPSLPDVSPTLCWSREFRC